MYSLKFTMLSKCAPSFVSNPMDEISRFVKGVFDLVKEECCTSRQYDDMTLDKLIGYSQSIKESKLKRMSTYFKRI